MTSSEAINLRITELLKERNMSVEYIEKIV